MLNQCRASSMAVFNLILMLVKHKLLLFSARKLSKLSDMGHMHLTGVAMVAPFALVKIYLQDNNTFFIKLIKLKALR